MGLDMYLTKKTYVKHWNHNKENFDITVTKGGSPVSHIQPKRVSYIEEEVGYWRKANQIHSWFVENVQKGEDDCGDYWISDEQMQELLDTVRQVLASVELIDGVVQNGSHASKETGGKWEPILEKGKIVDNSDTAEKLLPATSGFFFGSTDYDEYYIDNLKRTEEILVSALAEAQHGDFYYHSSW